MESYMHGCIDEPKIGSSYFVTGKPAHNRLTKLCMIDWLPTCNLGHDKEKVTCINRKAYEIRKKQGAQESICD